MKIEGGERPFDETPAQAFGEAVGGGSWHYQTSHAADLARSTSRKRVERLMRDALAYGGAGALRAMTLQPQTGQPGEVPDREEWATKASVGFDGLSTRVCHLTSPGPYAAEKEGYPIFVSERELEAFTRRYSPTLNVFAQADLIARAAWEAPGGADAAGLADLPGGEWITLPRVLNFLSFGQAAFPDGGDPLVTLRRQQQAFRALLERARNGKIKMEGVRSMGGAPQVPHSVFAHDLIPTDDLDGFESAPPERMDAFARWWNEKTDGLLWRHVTVSRASLEAWLGEIAGAAGKKPAAEAEAEAEAVKLTLPMFNLHTALCEIYDDKHGGVAMDKPAKRAAAVRKWRNQQKAPRNILPGSIERSLNRLDKNVFHDGKPVKLKGK
jgi:hypothetical protein